MEPEGSLPHPQKAVSGPNPEPDASCLHLPTTRPVMQAKKKSFENIVLDN
jgi:hypothetical protein